MSAEAPELSNDYLLRALGDLCRPPEKSVTQTIMASVELEQERLVLHNMEEACAKQREKIVGILERYLFSD